MDPVGFTLLATSQKSRLELLLMKVIAVPSWPSLPTLPTWNKSKRHFQVSLLFPEKWRISLKVFTQLNIHSEACFLLWECMHTCVCTSVCWVLHPASGVPSIEQYPWATILMVLSGLYVLMYLWNQDRGLMATYVFFCYVNFNETAQQDCLV